MSKIPFARRLGYRAVPDGKDDTTSTTISVGISIFELVSGLAGAYGALIPEPVEKTIAAVVVAGSNAYLAVLKTTKGAKAIHMSTYNYITEGV